jgi:hypothetical protein
MNNTIKITNEDIGILFHPEAVKMRREALAFVLLRIICESNEGMLKKEIIIQLRKEYKWGISDRYSTKGIEYDPIERSLLYLQNPDSDGDATVKSKSPFVRTRLRQKDMEYVYRATGEGRGWIKRAKSEYEENERSVKKNAAIAMREKFGEGYSFLEQGPRLDKEIENLIIDRLRQVAFKEANDALRLNSCAKTEELPIKSLQY